MLDIDGKKVCGTLDEVVAPERVVLAVIFSQKLRERWACGAP